jgi:hypothetical protein
MTSSTPPTAGLTRRAFLIAAAAAGAAGYLAVPANALPARDLPPGGTPPQPRPHRTLLGVL